MNIFAFSNGAYRILGEGELPTPFEFTLADPDEVLINSILCEQVRSIRSERLRSSDWTQVMDSPLSPELKSQWSAYRQSLRDIPSQSGFPGNVSWPQEPSNES